MNLWARASVKEIPSYQEHPRPKGNKFWDKFYSGLRPSSHEGPGDAVGNASSQDGQGVIIIEFNVISGRSRSQAVHCSVPHSFSPFRAPYQLPSNSTTELIVQLQGVGQKIQATPFSIDFRGRLNVQGGSRRSHRGDLGCLRCSSILSFVSYGSPTRSFSFNCRAIPRRHSRDADMLPINAPRPFHALETHR